MVLASNCMAEWLSCLMGVKELEGMADAFFMI
jgi:hypothetical protein